MEVSKARSSLEDRTYLFAKDVRAFVRKLPRGVITIADGSQLVRSSGSVGANYLEAQEALSKKDFGFRVRICRKEAKESLYWLRLFDNVPADSLPVQKRLTQEAGELVKIFSAIVEKTRQ
jgi:four helix bundle protein